MRLLSGLSALADLTRVRLKSLYRADSPRKDLRLLFDNAYYLARYPDVARTKWPPFWHYILIGASENRDPHRLFDTRYYREQNPDVRQAGINPLIHYVLFGAAEGRDPHPQFDTTKYSENHPEVGNRNPLVHYLLQQDHFTVTAMTSPNSDVKPLAAEQVLSAGRAPRPAHNGFPEARLQLLACSNRLSEALSTRSAPLVSAIIPCYNYGKYIWDAVGSLLAQSYPQVEIVVIDDGSTDPETLATLAEIRHKRVKVIHQSNQGLAQTRNNGASVANGEYLIFLDADDRLYQSAIALLLYALLQNPSAAYAYSSQRLFGDQELIWTPQEYDAYDLLWSNHPSVCALTRRAAFEAVQGYRPEMLYGYEDWEFWLRLSGKGHFGVLVSAPVFEHRRHGATMTHMAHQKRRFLYSQILALNSGSYYPESITARKRTWRPLLSVVIPFYNRTTYLKETLASLEQQTTQDFEVILVNDGSDDPEALRFCDGLSDVEWIRRVDCGHRGPSAARNTGAMLARSEYLMFLDSDDLLEASAIEKLCWTLTAHPEVSFVYSGVAHFGDIQAVCYDEFDAKRLYRENYLAVTCVIRREVFLGVGGFDEGLTDTHEDYDFWLRLVEQGHRGKLFREALFLYRRHATGTSAIRIGRSAGGAETLAESVVARLRNGAPRLAPLCNRLRLKQDALLEEAAASLSAAVPASMRTESYRRPSLPNLFCPSTWNSGRIHVLYLIPSFAVGGAEVFDLRIFSCLPREHFRITLVACEQPDGVWYEEFRAGVDEIYSLERMGCNHETRMAFLRYLMVAKRIDIVFNRNTLFGYELAAEWPAVSSQTRFVDLLHLHADGGDWVRSSAPYHDKLDLRYVISEHLREYASRTYNLSPERFRILRYGMSARQMPEMRVCLDLRRAIRQKWNIPDSAFVVGFIGRMTDQKDPQRWISVAARIAAAQPSTVFLLVGDGELFSESVALARERLGARTVFAGYQCDAAQYCAAMDVLLMTSKYEGVPLVILEALAHGTPVVSTDVGGVRECVDSNTGVILPVDASDNAYAKAVIEFALERDRTAVWTAARSLLLAHFSEDRMKMQLQLELSSLAATLDRDTRRRDYQLDLMVRPILG